MAWFANLFFRFQSPYARIGIALGLYTYVWFVAVGVATLCSGPLMGVPLRFLR